MNRKCSYFLRTGSMSEVRGPVESSYPRAASRGLGLPRFNGDTYESGTQHATLHRGQSFQLCGSAEQRAAGPHTHSRLSGALLWGWATGKPRSVGAGAVATRLDPLQSAWLNTWTQVQINVEEMKTGSFSHAA